MQHLFTPEGEAALDAVIRRRPLLVFDFDGTLAPIVERPEDARIAPAVAAQLAALQLRLPVAIVTGRRIDDVRGRLGFEPTYVVGSHGAEDEQGIAISPAMQAAMARVRERIEACRSALQEAGVTVEDKDSSIALHYRLARSRDRALEVILQLLTPPDGELHVFGGKMVVNVMPRHAPDKATAVRRLLARSARTCVLFAGDDLNDEPVFVAAQPDWLTIRVGDGPARSRAQYFVADPDEVALLLLRIAALLSAP